MNKPKTKAYLEEKLQDVQARKAKAAEILRNMPAGASIKDFETAVRQRNSLACTATSLRMRLQIALRIHDVAQPCQQPFKTAS